MDLVPQFPAQLFGCLAWIYCLVEVSDGSAQASNSSKAERKKKRGKEREREREREKERERERKSAVFVRAFDGANKVHEINSLAMLIVL